MEVLDYQIPKKRNAKYADQHNKLREMGFDETSVISALDTADGSLEMAMGILLDENTFPISEVEDSLSDSQESVVIPTQKSQNPRPKPKVDMRETHKKFMMAYKVHKCKEKAPHDKRLCMYYHGRSDRRRNPFEFPYYTPSECPASTETSVCEEGDNCLRAHNMLERMFHPELFKISMCQRGVNGGTCERGNFCAFAHSDDDLRVPQVRVQPATLSVPVPNPNQSSNLKPSATASSISPSSDSTPAPAPSPPQSKLGDSNNILQERLIRLVKSAGKAGLRHGNISKLFFDTYAEKLPLPLDDSADKVRWKDLLLAHPHISVTMFQGLPVYVYEDRPDAVVRIGLGYRDVTAGSLGAFTHSHTHTTASGNVQPITTGDSSTVTSSSTTAAMNAMSTMSISTTPGPTNIPSPARVDGSQDPPPPLPPCPPTPSMSMDYNAPAPVSYPTPTPSIGTHVNSTTGPNALFDLSPKLIPVKSRPRGPSMSFASISLEDTVQSGNWPLPLPNAGPSSLASPSPLSLADPVFFDMNSSISGLADSLTTEDRSLALLATVEVGVGSAGALTPFQRAIGAVGAGPRRRGPSLSVEELSLGQLSVNAFSPAPSPSPPPSVPLPPSAASPRLPLPHQTSAPPPPASQPNHITHSGNRLSGGNHAGERSLGDYSDRAPDNNQVSQLLSKIEKISTDLATKTRECSERSQALDEANRNRIKLEESYAALTKEKLAVEEQFQQQRVAHSANLTLITSQTKELQSLREALKEKDVAISKAESTKNSLVPELKQLRIKYNALEKELENTKNMVRSQRSEHERRRAGLANELEAAKNELNVAKSQLNNEKNTSRQQLEVMQNALKQSDETRTQLSGDLKRSQIACAESLSAQEELKLEVLRLKSALTNQTASTKVPAIVQKPIQSAVSAANGDASDSLGSKATGGLTTINANATATTTNSASSGSGVGVGDKKPPVQATEKVLGCSLPGCVIKGLFRCSACNGCAYCGPEHQREHWKVHKKDCANMKAAAEKKAAECALNGNSESDA